MLHRNFGVRPHERVYSRFAETALGCCRRHHRRLADLFYSQVLSTFRAGALHANIAYKTIMRVKPDISPEDKLRTAVAVAAEDAPSCGPPVHIARVTIERSGDAFKTVNLIFCDRDEGFSFNHH